MTGAPRVCPIADCTARIARGQLLCRTHWGQVPRHLQRDVELTWGRFQDGDATLRELSDAQNAAIHAVEVRA